MKAPKDLTESPWFWNPYRSSITQQNPQEKPDLSKNSVALLYTGHGITFKEVDAKMMTASPKVAEALNKIIETMEIQISIPANLLEPIQEAYAALEAAGYTE